MGEANEKMNSCPICSVLFEDNIHARRCFMTGEFCSKQSNIQQEKRKLHTGEEKKKEVKEEEKGKIINAFVIMNFSDMSDVVYKWRIKKYIESLSKYLYVKEGKLYCNAYDVARCDRENMENVIPIEGRIKKINVVRSDTEPANNYVVCNRICQQLQIADLVVVDVSSQNPNVFYELGMAIAFDKLILPICYSESYFKIVVPDKLKKMIDDYKGSENDDEYQELENLKHHIDCYPWRRKLYEYYGIIYKRNGDNDDKRTRYLEFDKVKKYKYGFGDYNYGRFPYHERRKVEKNNSGKIEEVDDEKIIGERIYEQLKNGYNKSEYCDNTLVVYTLENYLNMEQAGRCIVNFYNNVTKKLKEEHCFCGERVGVLVQENVIPESDKDTYGRLNLNYNIGEIVHIGVNEATYLATEEKIKVKDNFSKEEDENVKKILREIEKYMKKYTRNKGVLVYPNNPVFVERVRRKLQNDLFLENMGESKEKNLLYHIMLKTLKYTNQIVVDISNNNLQSLFWLGVAHGKGVHAITVLHEDTDKERQMLTGSTEKKVRNVFDVAGLWTAVFQSNDTDGFYAQLANVYEGIERHSKLMLSNREYYEKKVHSYLTSSYSEDTKLENIIDEKNKEEEKILESYYRSCFLNKMLCYNKLFIYLEKGSLLDENNQPKGYTSKWDSQAVAALSNYMSKRTLIGEYRICNIDSATNDADAEKVNYIAIGQEVMPLGKEIIQKRNDELEGKKIHIGWQYPEKDKKGEVKGSEEKCEILYKGFQDAYDKQKVIAVQHTSALCAKCEFGFSKEVYIPKKYEVLTSSLSTECEIGKKRHIELGQLLLWREEPAEENGRIYYRVELNGSSGPATLALVSIFVNTEQKKEIFKDSEYWEKNGCNINTNLLYNLQSSIRKQFMEKFIDLLNDELKKKVFKTEDSQKKARYKVHRKLILNTVSRYLNTILYRYFLPFISDEDIAYITNSMDYFVKSMRAESESPFAINFEAWRIEDGFNDVTENHIVNDAIKKIPENLKKVLECFRGVEVFYNVMVGHNYEEEDKKEDTRTVLGIGELKLKQENNVNCLFVKCNDSVKCE